ncbi:hypothetical protein [Candidatus Lokiarchaeum ossiferum]|uniref:hypothetical protein n=1 Tax=Candidatus Lokiarchaeum ossiferum TaxID=2951803 RepID=UPI00352D4621
MSLLTIITIFFLVMEFTNVGALYFFPGTKYANAVGVFNAWEKSKQDLEVHRLVKYLTSWVAGTKLIFIGLLIVILLTADATTQWWAAVVMVLSIASFFWKLFPLIRKMDNDDQISPKKYSLALGIMIAVFISMFIIAVIFAWPF